ncbi:3-oxoacyl-ACP reductase [Spirochaetia bacterium]|nr:3-oxoacyl-ACP reductase [Spirochaetia bacterium]
MGLMQNFSLAGKKAVVTGGARGIGGCSAALLAEAGADVAIIDLIDTAESVKTIKSFGRESFSIKADVTVEDQVNQALAEVKAKFGRIDVVFSNAGIAHCANCEDMTFEEWRKVIAVDLDSMFLVNRAAARIMIADKSGGSIVNTASMSGIIVNCPQAQVAYNAAKAGVIQLTRSLACEWAQHNIRVNSISPGYVCTDMTPATSNKEWMAKWFAMGPTKRLGKVEEIAGAVLYFASPISSFTTGANLVIDGGYSCY